MMITEQKDYSQRSYHSTPTYYSLVCFSAGRWNASDFIWTAFGPYKANYKPVWNELKENA